MTNTFPTSVAVNFVLLLALHTHALAQTKSPPANKLPRVPNGFQISVYASEPFLYKPTTLCFDSKGRAMVGMGPQYHLSNSIKKTDSVYILEDRNNDGVADRRRVFATGFNSIQGLAWKGNDLYVANSPELTLVRDTNGDDVADEYIVIYTDLGNHEHALHGLVFGPDGRLYMSKGNSKGHNQPKKYGRVAPKAFRELWDVVHPKGAPDIPPPKKYTAANYKKTYHDPHDDWGRQGGVLRCDPMGSNLEIVSRGMRNPWDIAIDSGFNIVGTDNDQTQGDRIIMPFVSAHFGWGHRYTSHWTGKDNLPTVPVSGPMTSGSWAGITYYAGSQFPANYQKVFFVNDWLFGTYVFRPGWRGALRSAADGSLEPFIQRRPGGMIYRPTDIEFGPDGAIYSLGWGSNYHYEPGKEGSWLFRVTYKGAKHVDRHRFDADLGKLTPQQLVSLLGADVLPARRVNAQDELIRRTSLQGFLAKRIESGELSQSQQTWAVWALGRMTQLSKKHQARLVGWAVPKPKQRVARNLRIQATRVLAYRHKKLADPLPKSVPTTLLADSDPRIRFEAMQAVLQSGLKAAVPAVVQQLETERDRVTYYSGWQVLRRLLPVQARKLLLNHTAARVRLAALLSLQEDFAISRSEVMALVDRETDTTVQSWALTFAMNPTPPKKLVNTTLRIEMEQSIPIAKILAQANKAKSPQLRKLYLQMVSRASVREGKQQQQLLAFYRTLKSDDERALILPAAATTLAAMPDLWEGLNNDKLRIAAVAGIGNLHSLRVKQLRASEGSVQATAKSLSDVSGFATEIAARLMTRLSKESPRNSRVSGALAALNNLPLPAKWSLSASSVETLLKIMAENPSPIIRRPTLRLLSKLHLPDENQRKRIADQLKGLTNKPNAQLYRELELVNTRLSLQLAVPKPKAATVADVLTQLPKANPRRGRALFYDRAGASCASCHRVRGKGSDLAPDLSGVGLRLKPQVLVQSIIHPSAAITEGYAMQLVLTKAGKPHRGAVVKNTPSSVTLLRSDGTQLTIRKSNIQMQQRLKQSVMPDGYKLYGAKQLADLTAWLLTLRK